MIYNKNVCSLFLALLTFLAFAPTTRAQDTSADLQDIQVDVVYLASDFMEGRETGTDGEARAASYIASRFEDLGLQPFMGEAWYHSFDFKLSTNPHAAPGTGEPRVGHNVVGYLDNGADQTVVIGAHYDHLGHGIFGSRQPDEPAIHNGADDNASGVAGILEIARQLKESGATGNNYIFIGFSGEELGLYGSKAFVKSDVFDADKVNYMINLDMVGRLNADKVLAVNGTGTSPAWDDVLASAKPADFDIKKHESGIGASDHTSFYLEDIPALHFFTGQHAEYHKASDDSPLINFEGIYEVASYIVEIIETLDQDGELAFTKTKDEENTRSTFKVSMGIMPDYVADGVGVRVDAVMDGRPAAVAGLEKGDIVIQLGEVKVDTINDYMMALGKLEKGDKTTVVVKRGDKEIKKDIQF
ncbi:MAG: M20/M25/M40 family metallo-hydrolase [Rhodothermales bacterium]